MGKINVPKIIESEDAEAALVALKKARQLAWNGDVLELLDLLAPEGKREYTMTLPNGKTKVQKN